jgi:competence protein ComEA
MRTIIHALAASIILAGLGLAPERALAQQQPGHQLTVPKLDKLDLNSATVDELAKLPGISNSTAKKIVAGRPYKSVDELKSVGLSSSEISKIKSLVTVSPAAAPTPGEEGMATLNINTATEAQLKNLPGIGDATAKKIISGRPYKAVEDLKAAGVPEAEIGKIETLVNADRVSVNAASTEELSQLPGINAATAKKIVAGRPYKTVADVKTAGVSELALAKLSPILDTAKVNLNKATPEQLAELPGVGSATAKKIIAGRPYKSVEDLKAAGISDSEITKISPLVSVGAMSRAGEESTRTPPKPGMVWANPDTKIYHKEGDRWYGKTEHGEWMTEAEAIKAGYHAAK